VQYYLVLAGALGAVDVLELAVCIVLAPACVERDRVPALWLATSVCRRR
jgi:hypothetical protein